MKTIRIIFSILGIALTSIAFGQLVSQRDGGILFYRVAYNSINDRLEHHLDEYPDRRIYGDQFESSEAARTYFAPMENDVAVETWMRSPFESNYFEVEPFIESWMTRPFESNYFELEPKVESWMTAPFDVDEEIKVEAWMTTSWM